jgi:hypothetical protein
MTTTVGYRIAKLGYSSRPWRIVDHHGNELSGPIPGVIPTYLAPVCFNSKAEAVTWLGEQLWLVDQDRRQLMAAYEATKVALARLVAATDPIVATQSATNELAMALLEAKVAG